MLQKPVVIHHSEEQCIILSFVTQLVQLLTAKLYSSETNYIISKC